MAQVAADKMEKVEAVNPGMPISIATTRIQARGMGVDTVHAPVVIPVAAEVVAVTIKK